MKKLFLFLSIITSLLHSNASDGELPHRSTEMSSCMTCCVNAVALSTCCDRNDEGNISQTTAGCLAGPTTIGAFLPGIGLYNCLTMPPDLLWGGLLFGASGLCCLPLISWLTGNCILDYAKCLHKEIFVRKVSQKRSYKESYSGEENDNTGSCISCVKPYFEKISNPCFGPSTSQTEESFLMASFEL